MKQSTPRRLANHSFFKESFPFNIHPHWLDIPFELHWHEFFEMTFVLKGMGVHRMNGVDYTLQPGTLFLLTPADFHEIIPDAEHPLHMVNIHFTERMIGEEVLNLIFQTTNGSKNGVSQVSFEIPLRQQISQDIELLLRESKKDEEGYASFIRATLERILIELLRMIRKHDRFEEQNPFTGYKPSIRKALMFIHKHFRRTLTLQEAAQEAGLSPAYFSSCFHESTGISFQKYIQELRLQFANSLLSGSTVSVTEICHASGFGTLTYFEKVYKEKYGCSPKKHQMQAAKSS